MGDAGVMDLALFLLIYFLLMLGIGVTLYLMGRDVATTVRKLFDLDRQGDTGSS